MRDNGLDSDLKASALSFGLTRLGYIGTRLASRGIALVGVSGGAFYGANPQLSPKMKMSLGPFWHTAQHTGTGVNTTYAIPTTRVAVCPLSRGISQSFRHIRHLRHGQLSPSENNNNRNESP